MKRPLTCAALLLFATSAITAQEYEVKFSRAHKVGDKRTALAKSERTMEQWLVVNGKQLTEKDTKVTTKSEITVDVTDAAVDADGGVTKADGVVKSCRYLKNDQEADVLKAGDKVHAEKIAEGKSTITVNGQPASADANSILTFMLPSGGDDDKAFGPKHKVKVGESWPMDVEFGQADLNKRGIPAPKGSVKGGVKLVSVQPVRGEPCLQLAGFTDVDMAGVAIPNGPPGAKAKKFEIHIKLSTDLPVNEKLSQLHEAMDSDMASEGVGAVEKNGQSISFSFFMEGRQKQDVTYTPAP